MALDADSDSEEEEENDAEADMQLVKLTGAIAKKILGLKDAKLTLIIIIIVIVVIVIVIRIAGPGSFEPNHSEKERTL